MNKEKMITFLLFFCLILTSYGFTHCEIPCGIYNDQMRIEMLKEHIKTIEKSIKQIQKISNSKQINYNQLVRWIDNKEAHASKMQEIVYQYFMTQRIKPVDKSETESYNKYLEQLTLLHEILVFAMKSKQTVDIKNINKLEILVDKFKKSYFGERNKK